jgi:hypothetical protein
VRLHGHLLGNSSSAHVAQSVEHILGKDEVTGSNPVMGLPPGAVGEEEEDRFFGEGKNLTNKELTWPCAKQSRERRNKIRNQE